MKDVLDLNRNILSGRPVRRMYDFPQPSAPILVREYLMATVQEKRCCIIRWFLVDDIPVDSMTFEMTQLGASGEDLETTEVTYEGRELPHIRGGQIFTPEWGIPVGPHCVSVRIKLLSVVSGSYIYTVKPDELLVDYKVPEHWLYDPREISKDKLTDEIPLRVKSKLGGRMRGIWPVALIGALCMIISISTPYLVRFRDIPPVVKDILNLLFA